MECPVRPTTVHATFGGGFFVFAALNLDELLEFAFFISTPSLTLLHATWMQTHSIGIAFPDKHMSSMSQVFQPLCVPQSCEGKPSRACFELDTNSHPDPFFGGIRIPFFTLKICARSTIQHFLQTTNTSTAGLHSTTLRRMNRQGKCSDSAHFTKVKTTQRQTERSCMSVALAPGLLMFQSVSLPLSNLAAAATKVLSPFEAISFVEPGGWCTHSCAACTCPTSRFKIPRPKMSLVQGARWRRRRWQFSRIVDPAQRTFWKPC
jgi:hypothetical protein